MLHILRRGGAQHRSSWPGEIAPNPFNRNRNLGDLTDLAQSIQGDGVLQSIALMHAEPFLARPAEALAKVPGMAEWTAEHGAKKYVVLFGERRVRGQGRAPG